MSELTGLSTYSALPLSPILVTDHVDCHFGWGK
jgi:hypothetical protein